MAMPTMVAVDARLRTVGDEIAVTHNVPGSDDNEVAIVPEGGDAAEAVETLAAAGDRGTTSFETAGWDPGPYEVVLTDGDGAEVARAPFVKICGITDEAGIRAALAAGADAIGLNLVPGTPRELSLAEAANLATVARSIAPASLTLQLRHQSAVK